MRAHGAILESSRPEGNKEQGREQGMVVTHLEQLTVARMEVDE